MPVRNRATTLLLPRQQLLNLTHGVVDLPPNKHLAELRRGLGRIPLHSRCGLLFASAYRQLVAPNPLPLIEMPTSAAMCAFGSNELHLSWSLSNAWFGPRAEVPQRPFTATKARLLETLSPLLQAHRRFRR